MHPRSLSASHGDSMGITVVAVGSVFLVLATVAVGIRLWSRNIQRQSLLLNDYAILLGWLFAASLVISSNIIIVRYGDAGHTDSLNPANIPHILKAYIAADAVWAAANTSIKFSIVHFYITIFRSNKMFLKVAYAVMALVLAFGVAVFISDVLTCRPLAKAWDPLQPGICESPFQSLIALSSCNMAIDLIIVVLPMPMVWGLQMALRRKVELTIIFALGFLVCVVTLVRIVLSTQVQLEDYTYGVLKVSIVTILEPLLGLIVACLPLFPPAIKKVASHMGKTHPEMRNVYSSSMARLRLKRPKSSTFQSSDDSSPLTDLEAKGAQNHITSPSDGPFYLSGGYNKFAGVRAPPQSSIMVEQDWQGRSDEMGHLEGKM